MRFRVNPSVKRLYCGPKWQEHGGEVTWELGAFTPKEESKIKEYREFSEFSVVLKAKE